MYYKAQVYAEYLAKYYSVLITVMTKKVVIGFLKNP